MTGLRALIGFGRPHTLMATTVQAVTIFLLVAGWAALSAAALGVLALALVASLALNLYVVGLNQLTDVAIDRVNKPWLPLASGQLSVGRARGIVAAAAGLALALSLLAGPYLALTTTCIMAIGTLYSLPPARLKRFPVPAALSIAVARGLLANLGLALHYGQALGVRPSPLTLGLVGVFFFGFGLVIAIYKDMPDLLGDRMYQIETFTTRLGARRALGLGRAVLSICYAVPIALALTQLPEVGGLFLLLSHLAIVALFWAVSLRVDLSRQASLSGFYQFLWALFYAEFGVLSLYELARAMV